MRPYKPSSEELEYILNGFGPDPFHPYLTIAQLVDAGYLRIKRDHFDYTNRDITAWARDHDCAGIPDSSATHSHLEKKVIGAWYLDRMGHEMERTPVSDSTGDAPLFRYTSACFEQPVCGYHADVCCPAEGCTTVFEAGYTPPRRLLSALGYTSYRDEECVEEFPETPTAVRYEDTLVDRFYVYPYGRMLNADSGKYIYAFEPTEDIPDADPSLLGEMLTPVFEDE